MAENGKAKYYALMEEMKTDILSGKIRPGEKLPSENQLSVRYGLSRHTVRKALGILAGDGYIESFQGKGTFCADVLRQIHGTGNIAVVTTYISDYIFPRLIQGIDEVLSDNGYSIILKNTGNSRQKEARFLEELISKGIDGLIIEPSKSELLCRHVSLYETLDKYQIPYIFIQGLYTEMQEKPHILMDDAGGGYLVAKHLLDSGRRDIAGFFKADDRQGIERHKGYVKALQEHGIAYDPDKDLRNTCDSVFCGHGAGYLVPWYEVEDKMHMPMVSYLYEKKQEASMDQVIAAAKARAEAMRQGQPQGYDGYGGLESDLEEIFVREFGEIKRRLPGAEKRVIDADKKDRMQEAREAYQKAHARDKKVAIRKKYLLVDGYNVIFAWKVG